MTSADHGVTSKQPPLAGGCRSSWSLAGLAELFPDPGDIAFREVKAAQGLGGVAVVGVDSPAQVQGFGEGCRRPTTRSHRDDLHVDAGRGRRLHEIVGVGRQYQVVIFSEQHDRGVDHVTAS